MWTYKFGKELAIFIVIAAMILFALDVISDQLLYEGFFYAGALLVGFVIGVFSALWIMED